MKSSRLLVVAFLASFLLAGSPVIVPWSSPADAKSSFGKSGGSSSGRSSSWSSQTRSTWDRSGGGVLGSEKGSSSGYSKPSIPAPQLPSGYAKPSSDTGKQPSGYSKPSLGTRPDSSSPAQPGGQTPERSSGYTKPSVGGRPADSPPGEGRAPQTPQASGYTKPSFQREGSTPGSPATPAAGGTSSGYTKPSASAATTGRPVTGATRFDKETVQQERKQRSKESLDAYKTEQGKFKKPELAAGDVKPDSHPLADKSKVYTGFDYKDHYGRRDNYYQNRGYQAPGYAFNSRPSFGVFDTLFLFWMVNSLTHPGAAATAYHHSDDPGYKQWRREADNLAKENPDLKAKLAELDKQVKTMEGTPKDPKYLPKEVPPEVALAPSVLAAKKPEKPAVKIATGAEGGWYAKFGDLFKKAGSELDVTLVKSNGSLDNLKALLGGQADLAIVQSDLLAMAEKKYPGKKLVSEQSTLYVEYVQLIANRDADIKSIKDINPRKHIVYIGPEGSGTSLTWQGLCELDPRYRKIPVRYSDYLAALSEVERNPKALLLFVGGLHSEFLRKAEEQAKEKGTLRLVALDDRAFRGKKDAHGNSIYTFVEIPRTAYPHLQKGWIFSGAVETLGVNAVLVLRTKWVESYGAQAVEALSHAVAETKPELLGLVKGEK